jgi:hypothetical protein
MRSKPLQPEPRRLEPRLGAESEPSFANQLSLEELPDDTDEQRHAGLPDRRSDRTPTRLIAYFVSLVALLGLTFACVHYLLPTLSEQVSRGAHALIEDAVKARAAIGAPSWQAATPDHETRKAREAARKEAAWKDFFRRSPRCAIEENQTSVECVNEYIRTRRDFDSRWEAGQL